LRSAVYEWNYARADDRDPPSRDRGRHDRKDSAREEIFSDKFLIKRPLLQALEPDTRRRASAADRRARPHRRAVRGVLLEVLSRLPDHHSRAGTVKASAPPIVVITSNRTREVHDALKRRCFYHWVGYPTPNARPKSCGTKAPGIAASAVARGGGFVQSCARLRICSSCRASPRPSIGRQALSSSTCSR
jgi:MoxR-like ATPase